MESTAQAIAITPKQRRQAERKRLRLLSLNAQLAWWASSDRRSEFPASSIRSDVKRLQKAIARLSTLTPSATWADDARQLRQDRGGDFPPKDEQGVSLMVQAIGEPTYYPAPYVVTSGHSYDTYVIAIITGTSPLLEDAGKRFRVTRYEVLYMTERAEMPDGYMGSVVRIGQLADFDVKRVRRAEQTNAVKEGRSRMITNVF